MTYAVLKYQQEQRRNVCRQSLQHGHTKMDEPMITGNHIEQDLVGKLTPDEIRSKRELGRSIMLGENNKYVPGHAVKFLTDAARAGDSRALAYLAECYYTGKVIARDPLKALDLALDSRKPVILTEAMSRDLYIMKAEPEKKTTIRR